MQVTNNQIIYAVEIKILVKENEKAELDKFIKTCEEHGIQLIRSGGGKLPKFSGYYAELKGLRWQKANTGERQSNVPDVVHYCWLFRDGEFSGLVDKTEVDQFTDEKFKEANYLGYKLMELREYNKSF